MIQAREAAAAAAMANAPVVELLSRMGKAPITSSEAAPPLPGIDGGDPDLLLDLVPKVCSFGDILFTNYINMHKHTSMRTLMHACMLYKHTYIVRYMVRYIVRYLVTYIYTYIHS